MQTAKELFEALSKFFNNDKISETERYNAWKVITALRGPDQSEMALTNETTTDAVFAKDATTAVIRKTLLGDPEYGGAGFDARLVLGIVVNHDSADHLNLRQKISFYHNEHFLNHAMDAFEVLGLKWDKVNE